MTYDVTRDGKRLGTYSEEGLTRCLDNGDLLPTDLVYLEREKTWAPLFQVPKNELEHVAAFTQKIEFSTPRPFITPLLLAINVAVFLVMVVAGVSVIDPKSADLIRWGADFGPLVSQGQWWRLLTAAFVHVGLLHIAFNMWAFLNVGIFVERLFGSTRFLTIYLLSAIGGNLLSIAWQPITVAAGASGAIFGVYGALIAFLVVRRKSIPPAVVQSLGRNATAFVGYNIIFGINPSSHIDMAAHLGGLLIGFLAAGALAWRADLSIARTGGKRSLAVALTGFALFAPAGLALRGRAGKEAETSIAAFTGRTLSFGDHADLIYSGSATEADARRLLNPLTILGFDKAAGATVLYAKNGSGSVVSVVLKQEALEDTQTAEVANLWGLLLSGTTGRPLKFRLINRNLRVAREFVYDGTSGSGIKRSKPVGKN